MGIPEDLWRVSSPGPEGPVPRELASARERREIRRRLVSALLILTVGLLPGAPAAACPSGGAEAPSHAHADHSLPQSGHPHPAGAALHDDAPESSPALDPGSPPEEPSEHSGLPAAAGAFRRP